MVRFYGAVRVLKVIKRKLYNSNKIYANLKVERSTKNEKGIISNNVCQYYYYGDRNSNQFFAT